MNPMKPNFGIFLLRGHYPKKQQDWSVLRKSLCTDATVQRIRYWPTDLVHFCLSLSYLFLSGVVPAVFELFDPKVDIISAVLSCNFSTQDAPCVIIGHGSTSWKQLRSSRGMLEMMMMITYSTLLWRTQIISGFKLPEKHNDTFCVM